MNAHAQSCTSDSTGTTTPSTPEAATPTQEEGTAMDMVNLREVLLETNWADARVSKPLTELTEEDEMAWNDLIAAKHALRAALLKPPTADDRNMIGRQDILDEWKTERPIVSVPMEALQKLLPVRRRSKYVSQRVNALLALYSLDSELSACTDLVRQSSSPYLHSECPARVREYRDKCATLRNTVCTKYNLGAAANTREPREALITSMLKEMAGPLHVLDQLHQEYREHLFADRMDDRTELSVDAPIVLDEAHVEDSGVAFAAQQLWCVMETLRSQALLNPNIDPSHLDRAYVATQKAFETWEKFCADDLAKPTPDASSQASVADEDIAEGYEEALSTSVENLFTIVTRDFTDLLDSAKRLTEWDWEDDLIDALCTLSRRVAAYHPATRAKVRLQRTNRALADLILISREVVTIDLAAIRSRTKSSRAVDKLTNDRVALLETLDRQYEQLSKAAGDPACTMLTEVHFPSGNGLGYRTFLRPEEEPEPRVSEWLASNPNSSLTEE